MLNWLIRRSKTPREIPAAILRSAIMGALLGPIAGLLINWLAGQNPLFSSGHLLEWVVTASAIGVLFSVPIYVTSGIPWIFLREPVLRMPRLMARVTAVSVCGVGGSLAALIAVSAIEAGLNVVLIPPDWMLRFIVVGGCFNIGIGFFFGAYHKLQVDAELKQRKLAETAARAQAYALQAQIAPHFFFNTLNSISALISADPIAAQKMIGGLADVFRYTLASSRMEVVPFDRELEFVRDYLSIEKIRYRDRLQFHLPDEGQTNGLALPGLTLQPLVENAIRHGISQRIEGGTIRVDLQPDGDYMCISVWNQFDMAGGAPNLSESEIFKPGHALANTRDRLRIAFGKDTNIEFSVVNTDWVRAMVFVPWKGKALHASTGH
jgi:hypothetical protein